MEKRKKKGWLKRQQGKIQLLPCYWKTIASIVIVFLFGTSGTQLFTASSDALLFIGFCILVLGIWLLVQIWLPQKK